MITLSHREAQITAAVVLEALGIAIAPESIQGLEIHSVEGVETVVVKAGVLHAIGKAYFQQLVAKHKALLAPKQVATQAKSATKHYKTPAERGISPITVKRFTPAQLQASAEKFQKRGVIVLPDGTIQPDTRFYELMGRGSQFSRSARWSLGGHY